MSFKKYLKLLVDFDGSDLYLTVGAPPAAKFQGQLKGIDKVVIDKQRIEKIAYSLMDEEQKAAFEIKPELNIAVAEDGIGRFRVNIFKQRNSLAMVVRNIKVDIPNADDLGLPSVLKKVIQDKNGLILFVGGTGSGKSTSLAALIDHRNSTSAGHIITIEDPIEYVHPHKKSLVSQREVGVDTECYTDALENTLRQAPDVILIGEIRTQETMEHALAFAETGHLCLSTLHANNANQALDRIINFFPEERKNQLLQDLSLNLKAFVSQRLVPTVDGKRVAAIEIMLGTLTIRELIQKGEVHQLKEIMERSEELGMQTFDSHLLKLYKQGIISYENAIKYADSPTNLQLKIKLSGESGAGASSPAKETESKASSGLSLDAPAAELSLESMDDGDDEDAEADDMILMKAGSAN